MLFLVPKDENLGEIVVLSCSWLLIFLSDSHVRFDCCFSSSGSLGFPFDALVILDDVLLVKAVSFSPPLFFFIT
jgi:hypothetical protein